MINNQKSVNLREVNSELKKNLLSNLEVMISSVFIDQWRKKS